MERKFIADAMLGKLARWMRIMGCDVAFFPGIDDPDLAELAARSGRLLLTRDTLLIRRAKVRENHFFVEGDHLRDQLRQVVQAFGIDPFPLFLTRCLLCNEPLLDVEKEKVRDHVPPYVFATQDSFRVCPSCGRHFWGGTHRARMSEELRRMLQGIPPLQ